VSCATVTNVCGAQLHTTQQEELAITIGCTATHGHIDKGVLWFELTDGSAAISEHLMTVSVKTCSATDVKIF
jgi:hypothetical protein